MKHWTSDALARMCMEKEDFYVFAEARPPLPFPGKYPTRIFMRADKKLVYFGKPSINAYRAMRSLYLNFYLKTPVTDAITLEFDRGGPIFVRRSSFPDMINEKLWGIYHPQTRPDIMLSWMSYGVKTRGLHYVIGGEDTWNSLK